MNAPHDPKKAAHEPHAPANAKTSPLRLAILLGVLVVVVGALVYDWGIAPPQVKAANEKLHASVIKHNEIGLINTKKGEDKRTAEIGGLLYSDDIQKILGMKPSKVENAEHYTIEYYRWWGWIPRSQNSITVLYIGDNPDKRFYSTHYVNELPEDSSLPGKAKPAIPQVDLTAGGSDNVAVPVPGAPGMGPGGPGMGPGGMGPGMGPPGMRPAGGGGDKAKGRPQGKGDKGTEKTEEAETKKADEPSQEKKEEAKPEEKADAKKSDAPAADGESKKEEPKKEKE